MHWLCKEIADQERSFAPRSTPHEIGFLNRLRKELSEVLPYDQYFRISTAPILETLLIKPEHPLTSQFKNRTPIETMLKDVDILEYIKSLAK